MKLTPREEKMLQAITSLEMFLGGIIQFTKTLEGGGVMPDELNASCRMAMNDSQAVMVDLLNDPDTKKSNPALVNANSEKLQRLHIAINDKLDKRVN